MDSPWANQHAGYEMRRFLSANLNQVEDQIYPLIQIRPMNRGQGLFCRRGALTLLCMHKWAATPSFDFHMAIMFSFSIQSHPAADMFNMQSLRSRHLLVYRVEEV